MIGFHFQTTTDNWPQAVSRLPAGTPVKAVDRADILREALQVNAGVLTVLRHLYDREQHFDGADFSVLLDRAERFFRSFLDETFVREHAPHVHVVETWNETLASTQTPEEQQWRVDQCLAFCKVWERDYAHRWPHIRLCLANAPVGNDIPIGIARLAQEYGHYLGYHAYIAMRDGVVVPADWRWYSGRWVAMDEAYRAQGIEVEWLFTEGGPVRMMPEGGLDPMGGWRMEGVCNGNPGVYGEVMEEWAKKVDAWNQQHGNRARGVMLFTTSRPKDPQWQWFQTAMPEMDMLATLATHYPPGEVGPPAPPPVPPPTPPPQATWYEVIAPAGLNLRSTPDTAHPPLALLPKGTKAIVTETAGDWLRVQAFAHRNWLVPAGGTPSPEPPRSKLDLGADVSAWQGAINWTKMKAEGITFAYIKATEGATFVDKHFAGNCAGAHAAGLPFGLYHYWKNGVPGRVQAAHFASQIAQATVATLPPALDCEENEDWEGDMMGEIKACLEEMERLTGVRPVVYTSYDWWNRHIGHVNWAGQYRLWLAAWAATGDTPPPTNWRPTLPAGWGDWWMWQWTSKAPGARYGAGSRHLDLNYMKRDEGGGGGG